MKTLLLASAVFILMAGTVSAQLTVSVMSQTNILCYGQCTGSVTVSATGGTGPYSYLWMPGNITSPTLTNACAGPYTCTVTDASSATATINVVITQPSQMAGTPTFTNPSCYNYCDGTAGVSISGGTPPYTYLWMPTMQTIAMMTNLCVGTYTYTVTDANGCTLVNAFTLTQPAPVTVTVTPSNPTICAGNSVTLSASGASTYSWVPGNLVGPSVVLTPTVTTTYTVMGTDPNGCTGTATVLITVNQPPTVTTTVIEATCNLTDGSATAMPVGNGPFAYYWQPQGVTTQTATGLAAGNYFLDVTDINGCVNSSTVTVLDSCDFVWPGDANDDAVADNIDILDIGIANGANGTTRPNATTTWIGQPSAPWGQTLLSGTDYKWVDCNGDGTISPLDTQAVILNYGMTHTNRYGAPVYAAAPTLSVTFNQDSVAAGNAGSMTLALGDAANQATNAYGIAFRVNYDAAQISTPSLGMSGGASWFGTPGNDLMRVVLHPSPANGFVDVAITRLDHQPVSGFGTIGQIYFTATNTLNGTGNAASVPVTITNVVLVDPTGAGQTVNASGDSVVVADSALITGITQPQAVQAAVYPNPANETMNVVIAGGAQQLVTIEDLSGRIVYSKQHASGANTISVASLPAGTYMLRVQGNNGTTSVQRIIVAH